MIDFKFKLNTEKLLLKLNELPEKQIPFATSLALNRTAKGAKEELVKKMSSSFQNPTPFIMNSTYILAGNKKDPSVEIGHKKFTKRVSPSPVLYAEIFGGNRALKASEKALGTRYVPSKFEPLDQYGNIPGGVIKKILSALSLSHRSSGYQSNITPKSKKRQIARGTFRDLVIIKKGNRRGLKPGVFERRGEGDFRRLTPVLHFIDSTNYPIRYPFYDIVNNYYRDKIEEHIGDAMRLALATQR